MKRLADAAARTQIATDLERTLVVEAAAGTGKTTALIGRLVAVLRTGRARLSEVVAVTFTEKAAGEMRLRLRGALEEARVTAERDVERVRFEEALAELEVAQIGTIHSFCADLLREFPVEARVDPEFEVIDEELEGLLVDQVFEGWFGTTLDEPPEAVRRIVRRGGLPRRSLRNAARALVARRDHPAAWDRPAFDREGEIEACLASLRGLAALAQLADRSDDYLAIALARIARFLDEVDERDRITALEAPGTGPSPDDRDYDALEADLGSLRSWRERKAWTHRGMGDRYGEGLMRADVLSRREAVAEQLDAFLARSEADLAAGLKDDLTPVIHAYEQLKRRTGRLDFLDLLIRARDLLIRDDAVREDLRRRFRCLFVDEFQDTDPLQAEILLILASAGTPHAGDALRSDGPIPEAGRLFVVGDPKQAIYRFRRADVRLYERIKRRLVEGGATLLHLSTSFRATPAIQRAINVAFEPEMQGAKDGSQASYVPLDPYREAEEGRPSVIALPVPRPYGRYGKIFKGQVEGSAAESVGAWIRWLLEESGWTIADPRSGELRPIESRDVCLLFRSTTRYRRSLVLPYLRALEGRGVPHVLVGGRASGERPEVLAMANALRAIEYPRDALSVYATLRGPFLALSDEDLLVFRARSGSLNPLAPREDARDEATRDPVGEALGLLRSLHVGRNRLPTADTIARFLDATRAHAGLAHWPDGEQALANVLRVQALARRFEARGATSFRAFVEYLGTRLEGGQGLDAPAVEERAAGVRIMTVHKAKGLEMPVVILCDPTLSRKVERPSRFVDSERGLWAEAIAGCAPEALTSRALDVRRADEAEEVRLTYVAATRARDLLVVPCVGDAPQAGWVDPLHRALYPDEAARPFPELAPGCPPFGTEITLERPSRASAAARSAVRPGAYEHEGVRVVWWDPALLDTELPVGGGIRRADLLRGGGPGDAGAGHLEDHRAWRVRRAETRDAASIPGWRARPVTALASELGAPEATPETVEVPRETDRPGGIRFGTLVHAVLAEISLDASAAAVSAMAAHQGRLLEATEDEIEAAACVVSAALEHPILDAARKAEEVRREVQIMQALDDETWAEGVIDLAFRDAGGWTVVDYKSDRAVGDTSTYQAQLGLYARAVAGATGEAVRAVILYI